MRDANVIQYQWKDSHKTFHKSCNCNAKFSNIGPNLKNGKNTKKIKFYVFILGMVMAKDIYI